MRGIDLHCDTLMQAYRKQGPVDLYNLPDCSVDLNRLHKASALAQCFAIFLPPPEGFPEHGMGPVEDETYIQKCREIFCLSLARHADIAAPAGCVSDILKNDREGKISCILTMEEGRAVAGNMENLNRFYEMGVRALALTWNFENCFGFPNSDDPAVMSRGLTDFGKEAVLYMQELGMLVDVSHLSDGGFYDVAQLCKGKKPFAATHSNCRALSPHQRNLSDEMIRILGDAGGVAGLNYLPGFLQPGAKESTAALLAKHARHMADVGGIDCVALGSDLDGIDGILEIDSPLKLGLLENALRRERFTTAEIDKIANQNALRVLADAIG